MSCFVVMSDCLLKDGDKGRQWFKEILDLGICVNIIKTTQENSIPNSYKFLEHFEKQIHKNNGVIFEVEGDHDFLLRNPKEIAIILDELLGNENFCQKNTLVTFISFFRKEGERLYHRAHSSGKRFRLRIKSFLEVLGGSKF